jgi:hypothetical protein
MNAQKWYQSKTLWMALVSIALLLAWGVVQMVHPTATHWLPTLLLGSLSGIAILANKLMAAKDVGAPVLSDEVAHILTYAGMGITVLYGYMKTQGIEFPGDVYGSIMGIIGLWVVGDRAKNAAIAPDTKPTPVAPVAPPKP